MGTSDWYAPFPHLAKGALAEDFEQFKLRWISFLTALFHMMSDRNLLICPFILHKQYQHETAIQDCRYVSLHAHTHIYAPRPQAHHYLHSVRKTLPPPWARPWSDAHWPAAEPTSFIRGVRDSKHFHKAWSSLFSAEPDYDCGWCTPTCMMVNSANEISESHAMTVCFHFSNCSCICCQTVWSPYSKPVQLSGSHPVPIKPLIIIILA